MNEGDADVLILGGGVIGLACAHYLLAEGRSVRVLPDALANQIAENHFSNVVASFEKSGSIWEHHAPDTPAAGRGRTDFCGWTGITPIAILLEYVLGLRPDPLTNTLPWDVRRLDEHGVSRYPFGAEGTLELFCEERSSEKERPRLRMKSNIPLKVDVVWAGGRDSPSGKS